MSTNFVCSGTDICANPSVKISGATDITQFINFAGGTCTNSLDTNVHVLDNNDTSIGDPIACHETVAHWGNFLTIMEIDNLACVYNSGNISINQVLSLGKDVLIMSIYGNISVNADINARNLYIFATNGSITINANLSSNVDVALFSYTPVTCTGSVYAGQNIVLNRKAGTANFSASNIIRPKGACSIDEIVLDWTQINSWGDSGYSWDGSTLIITSEKNVRIINGDQVLDRSIKIVSPCDVILPHGLVCGGWTCDITIICGQNIICNNDNNGNVPGIISYNTFWYGKAGNINLVSAGLINVFATTSAYSGRCSGICIHAIYYSGIMSLISGKSIDVTSVDVVAQGITGIAVKGDPTTVQPSSIITDDVTPVDVVAQGVIPNYYNWAPGSVSAIAGAAISITTGNVTETGISGIGNHADNHSGPVCVLSGKALSITSGEVGMNSATGIATWGGGAPVSVIAGDTISTISGYADLNNSASGITSTQAGVAPSPSVVVASCGSVLLGQNALITGNPVTVVATNTPLDSNIYSHASSYTEKTSGCLIIPYQNDSQNTDLNIAKSLYTSDIQKIFATDVNVNDYFGWPVAIDGDTAIVGAYYATIIENYYPQGAAYIFVRNGTTWEELQRLIAADGAIYDSFGTSVSISGDTAIVGAQGVTIDGSYNQGAAYIFVRNGTMWEEQQKLTASDGAAYDSFGRSVSISGNTVVVGSNNAMVNGNSAQGKAYVFVRNGAIWEESQILTASDGAEIDIFGISVSISADTAIVGARNATINGNSYQGAAYMFVRNGTMWEEQQKLTASDGAESDFFGESVSISKDTAIVGAYNKTINGFAYQGAAYIFARSGAMWIERQKLIASDGDEYDGFGYSVSISGNVAVVGASNATINGNANQGAAYVFAKKCTKWTEQQKLIEPDGLNGDLFGLSVANSGYTAIIANAPGNANSSGTPYIFEFSPVNTEGTQAQCAMERFLTAEGSADNRFGESVAIDGTTIIVGACGEDIDATVNQGSAYIFVKNGADWAIQQKLTAPDGVTNDYFGASVDISGDTAIVGIAPDKSEARSNCRSVYIFVRDGSTWQLQQQLMPPDDSAGNSFGWSVAISGNTAIVSSYIDDVTISSQGSACIFIRNGNEWFLEQKLVAPDGSACDQFGCSVALSGNTAIVGAYHDDDDRGAAYVFVRNGDLWNLQQKLTASDGESGDCFGWSVAMSGDTAIVGAYIDNVGTNINQGSAYIFVRYETIWTEQQHLAGFGGEAKFGWSVGISGNMAIVGASAEDVGGLTNQGAAYMFVKNGTNWLKWANVDSSNNSINDYFGASVAIDGNIAVIGAYMDDTQGTIKVVEFNRVSLNV